MRQLRFILLGLCLIAGHAFAATCTLDPSAKPSGVSLSAGNDTFTVNSGADGTGRGTLGYLAGSGVTNATYHVYFEITGIGIAAGYIIGIDQDTDVTTSALGDTSLGVGMYNSGHVFTNAVQQAAYFTYTTGDKIGVAVDFQHQKIWWTKNGTTWNNDIIANQNPATNTGGYATYVGEGPFGGGGNPYRVTKPAYGTFSGASTGNSGTFNGGLSAFAYTVPSGFSSWCSAVTAPPANFMKVPP